MGYFFQIQQKAICALIACLFVFYASVALATSADQARYPRGHFYYIIMDNIADMSRYEGMGSADDFRMKDEIEKRGYRFIPLKHGDVSSIKKAAFDQRTAYIALSAHGSEEGSITSAFWGMPRIRAIFKSKKVSPNLKEVIIGSCYSNCVAEQLDLAKRPFHTKVFGNHTIPFDMPWQYIGSKAFLEKLGSPIVLSKELSPEYRALQVRLHSAVNTEQVTKILKSFLSSGQYNADWNIRDMDTVLRSLLKDRGDIFPTVAEIKKLANIGLDPTHVQLFIANFLEKSRSHADFPALLQMIKGHEETIAEMDSALQTMVKNLVANGSESENTLFKLIDQTNAPGEMSEYLNRTIASNAMSKAKTARLYYDVLRIANEAEVGDWHGYLNLNPTPKELMQMHRLVAKVDGDEAEALMKRAIHKSESAALYLDRVHAYASTAGYNSAKEFIISNLTEFFVKKPDIALFKAVIKYCDNRECQISIAANFLSQANDLDELNKMTAHVKRHSSFFARKRIDLVYQEQIRRLEYVRRPVTQLDLCAKSFRTLVTN
jgi:hypothetical protein